MERESPLLSWHRGAGAKMVDFHGWQMPLSYGRISEEIAATRGRVGLFDLSHMGRIQIRGADRVAYLDRLFTGHVAEMQEGQVKYGFLCNESGGVIDDITVYCQEDYLLLVVNAANLDAVLPWLERHRDPAESVRIEDKTIGLSMFAVQGPEAIGIMDQLSSQRVSDLKYYTFTLTRVLGNLCLISRTGYTGEDGFEIYLGRTNAEAIWAALLRAAEHVGGVPVGLAARDTLRLEAGFPLHGQELSPKISPIEAGLEKFVAFEKRQFIGRSRLLDSTNSDISVRLVGLEMIGQAIPRTGYPICHHGVECGRVTSGGFSPTLGKAIGMGFVEQMLSNVGQVLEVRIRGKQHPANVVRRPFYKRKKKSAS
ncbi:glycine cleavage system aminomethyltransferase GcvT [Candidatus Sumerlaeota bacterium]|nr:glycine cleavage system aminomethyltransferase GcvT [Candidatus Sumerlaeota bacterium]